MIRVDRVEEIVLWARWRLEVGERTRECERAGGGGDNLEATHARIQREQPRVVARIQTMRVRALLTICLLVAVILKPLRIIWRSSMFWTSPSLFLSISRSRLWTAALSPFPMRLESAMPSCRGSVALLASSAVTSIASASANLTCASSASSDDVRSAVECPPSPSLSPSLAPLRADDLFFDFLGSLVPTDFVCLGLGFSPFRSEAWPRCDTWPSSFGFFALVAGGIATETAAPATPMPLFVERLVPNHQRKFGGLHLPGCASGSYGFCGGAVAFWERR